MSIKPIRTVPQNVATKQKKKTVAATTGVWVAAGSGCLSMPATAAAVACEAFIIITWLAHYDDR